MKERRYEVVEKIYDFDELSDSAKDNARREYLESFRCAEDFETFCKDDLDNYFENSDIKVQFSLCSCQGDGFNIYGKMKVSEAIDYVLRKTDKLNKNIRFFKWLKTLGYEIELPYNNRYSYCCVDRSNYAIDIEYLLEQDDYTSNAENHFSMLCDFMEVFKDLIEKLCKDYEQDGYKYFYEVEDEEIKDIWEANGYEGFYEDGSPCYS